VSWQLTSFLILAAVLAGGFAWYERSRPPSQVVALVAALAALAIAGRIAFAAFPNVKPTTDIVVFAGFALGGAPGFAVGALAALVSNFWFGQGPWTPWQMAGWGLCGILGAALALGGRNVSRLTLAATCGFAGIAYGALLNFSLMATYGGDLSLERFGVLAARAIPFDAAHAIGNIVIALVAGPAMVRMLTRFRERFEWRRASGATPTGAGGLSPALRGGGVAALLLIALALGAAAPARAQASEVSRATAWLRSVQNDDGGFGSSPGDASGAAMTGWAMLGLAAAGDNPLDVTRGGKSPVDFLRRGASSLKSPGDLSRTILALESAGVDPRNFGGTNLVSRLQATRRPDGSFEDWPNSTAYAVIALRTAGASGGLDTTLSWLRSVQNDDGGWGDEPGLPSNAEAAGSVLQSLSSSSKASGRGLSYLRQTQVKGGGYRLGGNGAVNSQATAWAVQGILAAGGDPGSFRHGGSSALDYLAASQASDGHFRYSNSSDQTPIWVTGQVLVAAAGEYLPISPPPRAPQPVSQTQSSAESGGQPPSTATLAPPSESAPVPLPGAANSGGGSPSEGSATPGQAVPGVSAGAVVPEGEGEGSDAAAPEPLASEAPPDSTQTTTREDSKGSRAGSIVLGLLAGCLAFGAALLARRGWMRWRYGL
jgi:energy-coupling factor transport system substrate-specific component